MIRHDAEIQELFRRYCAPARRYLKLGGAVLRMPREEYEPFVHALAADAKTVSDAELTTLLEGSWRERRTAAWLAAVSRRDHLRRPDLAYDQPTAMGALAHTDSVLRGDRAGRLLQEGGLWPRWFQDAPHMHGDDGISGYLGGIRLACAVADECANT
ncbi:MAG: hypothetical protein HOZ81_39645 [Streptomyces sp.]|nr:hypothetical protein [Streptomyces sp.]NUT28687.1 hypothetical protein [Streptomyces sp.]